MRVELRGIDLREDLGDRLGRRRWRGARRRARRGRRARAGGCHGGGRRGCAWRGPDGGAAARRDRGRQRKREEQPHLHRT
ncbi:MAG: hypothetical protein E6J27_06770 [Chloroflexi bacterium]|nr:MAG: hypothetical protein E6J27_06770 [Chloroflexota bacterium]